MIHHPTLTVTAAIDADTPEEALEFLRHRIEQAAADQARSWGTPLSGPLFAPADFDLDTFGVCRGLCDTEGREHIHIDAR